jgi:flavin-dependent dehydrogenase
MHEYGPNKVAIWDYFTVRDSPEGTTLYGAEMDSYMAWVWQIPIREDTVSVGYVATGEAIKRARSSGMGVPDIYRAQLNHFPALRSLLEEAKAIRPRVTSFRCRVYRKVAGPNWIVIGEAASMIDPMTSNGVTAALRQSTEAAQLIAKNRHRKQLPWRAATAYSWRVVGLARFFNCGIERVLYDWPVRKRIGPLMAGDVYTIPAWLMNLFYSRLAPRGIVCTGLFGCLLTCLRSAAAAFYWLCRQRSSSKAVPECSAC